MFTSVVDSVQNALSFSSFKVSVFSVLSCVYYAAGGASIAWPVLIGLFVFNTALGAFTGWRVYGYNPDKFRDTPKKLFGYIVIILAVRSVDYVWLDYSGVLIDAWKLFIIWFSAAEIKSISKHLIALGLPNIEIVDTFVSHFQNKVKSILGTRDTKND